EALTSVAGSVSTPQGGQAVVEHSFILLDEMLGADDYEGALRLAELAIAAARKVNTPALVTRVESRQKLIHEVQNDYERIKSSLTTLEKTPNDPEANLAVGKFYCLRKGNWTKGLPMLAKGGDEKWKALAKTE